MATSAPFKAKRYNDTVRTTKCSKCGAWKLKRFFSARQWRKGNTRENVSTTGPVCKACLGMQTGARSNALKSLSTVNTKATHKWPRRATRNINNNNNNNTSEAIIVSVIVPVHNALPWLDQAIESVMQQKVLQQCCLTAAQTVKIEVSMVDDCSTDASLAAIHKLSNRLHARGFLCVYSTTQHEELVQKNARDILAAGEDNISLDADSVEMTLRICYHHQLAAGDHAKFKPKGAGAARNQAVWQSNGQFLCILDADDMMAPDRIGTQLHLALEAARLNPKTPLLIGAGFTRKPLGSTKNYTDWANALTPERLVLEQFRELTIIQPTW